MKHLFIPYELAVVAKEKGFDEPCFNAYRNSDGEQQLMQIGEWTNSGIENTHAGYCAAPLYQQIVDWFREKHNIFIMAYPQDGWCYMFQDMNEIPEIGNSNNGSGTKFKSYYEALSKAIEEAFNLI